MRHLLRIAATVLVAAVATRSQDEASPDVTTAGPIALAGPATAVFWVDDFPAAVNFWQRVLGARPVYLLPDVGFGELRVPGTELRLGIARGRREGNGNTVVPTFAVDDLDTTLASLRALDVPPLRPVTEMPGLCRLVAIADPAGNEVQFVQSLRPATDASPWAKVAFLVGGWRAAGPRTTSEEVWTPPHGDTMYGQNRTLKNGDMEFFELLRIERRDTDLVYVAMPKGREGAEFRLTGAATNEAVFENPEHDFPKRITYRLDGQTLRARVDDGSDDGKHLEFRWLRIE